MLHDDTFHVALPVHPVGLFMNISVNTDWGLKWFVIKKYLEPQISYDTVVLNIVLRNYISYWGEPNYIFSIQTSSTEIQC